MFGVVNDVPLPRLVPPTELAYQLIVPLLAIAPNITIPTSQRELGVMEFIVGLVLTVAIIGILDEIHPLSVAST